METVAETSTAKTSTEQEYRQKAIEQLPVSLQNQLAEALFYQKAGMQVLARRALWQAMQNARTANVAIPLHFIDTIIEKPQPLVEKSKERETPQEITQLREEMKQKMAPIIDIVLQIEKVLGQLKNQIPKDLLQVA